MNTRTALFNRFTFRMKTKDAKSCSHSGDCMEDVKIVAAMPYIKRQFVGIPPELIAAELKEYGAWDETELADKEANRIRLILIAAGQITEEMATYNR